jgi:hypothetical protein
MTMFATAGMVTSFWGLVATAAIVDIEAAMPPSSVFKALCVDCHHAMP